MNDKQQLAAMGAEIAGQQSPLCMAKQIEQLQAQLADAKAEARKYKLAGLGMAASMGEHVCAQEGWQPIDTAPKDGTKILLFWPLADNGKGVTEKGHWDDDRHATKPRPYWTNSSARTWGANKLRQEPPTIWMPLPTVPKPQGGGA